MRQTKCLCLSQAHREFSWGGGAVDVHPADGRRSGYSPKRGAQVPGDHPTQWRRAKEHAAGLDTRCCFQLNERILQDDVCF